MVSYVYRYYGVSYDYFVYNQKEITGCENRIKPMPLVH